MKHRRADNGWILLENIVGLAAVGATMAVLALGMGHVNRLRQRLADQRAALLATEDALADLSAGDAAAMQRLRGCGCAWRVVDGSDAEPRVWVAVTVPGLGERRELLACVSRDVVSRLEQQP